jgi:heat shock protein HtpX
VAIAIIIGTISGLMSYYSGASMVLAASRAKEVNRDEQAQLVNVIEELCIAGGLPRPKIYLIDDTAPNAFATGRNPQHAAVAITTGLLQKLNRAQLQGVMAHELSHVRNYDILFATMVGILVGSIALLADVALRSMRWGIGGRRRSGKNGGGNAIFAIVAIVLAILAPIFAKMLQLSISRKREYLADASGVQLTRDPEGLAGALEIISRDSEVLEVANRATQHLYIVNPIKPFEDRAKSLFSTHPPIEERIRRLRAMS